jgi:hypothetical protein
MVVIVSSMLVIPSTSMNLVSQGPELDIDSVEGGFGIKFTITNSGDTEATNIEWSISFINCTTFPRARQGTIDSIQPGDEKTVRCFFLGLGKPKITINATCDNEISNEKSVSSYLTIIHFRQAFGKVFETTMYDKYEGETPGYWKNHYEDPRNAWNATGYVANDTLVSVFSSYYVEYWGFENDTLLDALRYKGGSGTVGGLRIFLRTAVAALLNAAHPLVTYPWEESKVIQWVNECLVRGDRNFSLSLKDTLDTWNNYGCEDKLY